MTVPNTCVVCGKMSKHQHTSDEVMMHLQSLANKLSPNTPLIVYEPFMGDVGYAVVWTGGMHFHNKYFHNYKEASEYASKNIHPETSMHMICPIFNSSPYDWEEVVKNCAENNPHRTQAKKLCDWIIEQVKDRTLNHRNRPSPYQV